MPSAAALAYAAKQQTSGTAPASVSSTGKNAITKIPTKIEGHTVEHLLQVAQGVVDRKTKDSSILDRQAEARIPKFDLKELTIGRVLGRGGFCVVSDISKIVLESNNGTSPSSSNQKVVNDDATEAYEDDGLTNNPVQDRQFMEKYCVRGASKDTRYAIKQLQQSTLKDAQTFVNGVVDLAVEARFLSVVRHPNIIKMRAMGCGSPYDLKFFVVLDRLYDILTPRVVKWKQRTFKGVKKLMDRGGKKEMAFWLERMTVAYDLACALKYLHDVNIIYRDLKPDNIGFDVRGDVKIFDFGLAKEVNPAERDADGFYKLTADTGSPRYMAPEVALGSPYDESADVYSFSILLWQILKMETPLEGYTMSTFTKRVVKGGVRPKVDTKWPTHICVLMKNGWGEPKSRPKMGEICTTLREEISKNSDEEIDEIMDASRKSEMSLRMGLAPS